MLKFICSIISIQLLAITVSIPGLCKSNGDDKITFASIPGGSFKMGSSNGEFNEKPVHRVKLDNFKISVNEITNSQFAVYLNAAFASGDITVFGNKIIGSGSEYEEQMYMDTDYSKNKNNKCWIEFSNGLFAVTPGKEKWPVVAVSWYGAKSFARFYGFDLPTEAEWEYVARGGKRHKYGTDNGKINTTKANYRDSMTIHPVDVGSYPPNPYGLFDMCGNVSEWCNDWYSMYSKQSTVNPNGPNSGTYRVVRGAGYFGQFQRCRSSARSCTEPFKMISATGFRVVKR